MAFFDNKTSVDALRNIALYWHCQLVFIEANIMNEYYANGQLKKCASTGDEYYENGNLKKSGSTGNEYFEDGSLKVSGSRKVAYHENGVIKGPPEEKKKS